MFPARRDVLRQKSGTLAATPLPLLLHALLVEERDATLELRLRNLEKRVTFEGGAPTGCESNLLHETLGPSLVKKGKLTEAQHHQGLAECVAAGKPLQVWLLEKQVLSAFDLFKHLQATLGRSLLDSFGWSDASWKLLPPDELDAPVRINALQLIFTGCQHLPAATLSAQLETKPETVFALLPDAPPVHDELKLSAKETRLVQALKRKATLAELCALPGMTVDEVHRRLYALRLLEFVDTAEAIAAMPVRSRPTPVPQPQLVAAPLERPAQGLPFLDEDPATQDLLGREFLSFRSKDAFELLGVTVDTQGAALQRAFLAKTAALAPVRFASPEARARAETLSMAYAKAFGALSESDTWQQHRDRRAARDSKTPQALRQKAAAEAVKIRTDLLDAQSQFEEGRKRLAAGNPRSALEHFQYALDIEPSGRVLAWLGWTRYQLEPNGAAACFEVLTRACEQDPACEEAQVWRGDLAMVVGRPDVALEAYRQAVKLAPKNARYAELLQVATKAARR
ncbi:MAG: tetratricopeptide repeat protein [Myxococcus sp.]|nr:tetratricopeptide repeat protein [Myxococcus sp.]